MLWRPGTGSRFQTHSRLPPMRAPGICSADSMLPYEDIRPIIFNRRTSPIYLGIRTCGNTLVTLPFQHYALPRSCDQPAISSKCTKVFCQATGPVQLSRRDCLFSALSALPVMMWTQRSSAESEDIPQYGPGIEAEQKTMKGVPFKAIVKRPPEAFTSRKNNQEEILSIGLEVPRSKVSGFKVFINLPNADEDTPVAIKEHVASHINLIGSGAPDSYRHTRLRVGIGDTIEDLGLSNASEIMVTIVPHGAEKDIPVYVKGLNIETEEL